METRQCIVDPNRQQQRNAVWRKEGWVQSRLLIPESYVDFLVMTMVNIVSNGFFFLKNALIMTSKTHILFHSMKVTFYKLFLNYIQILFPKICAIYLLWLLPILFWTILRIYIFIAFPIRYSFTTNSLEISSSTLFCLNYNISGGQVVLGLRNQSLASWSLSIVFSKSQVCLVWSANTWTASYFCGNTEKRANTATIH